MSDKTLELKCTAPPSMRYWLAVDEDDVELQNGAGRLEVVTGVERILIWWMVGNPGDALSITGTIDGVIKVVVKESKIPPNVSKGAGRKRFMP